MAETKIKFEKANEYKKISASGCWGGVTPQGDILINFFIDYKPDPITLTMQIREDGTAIEDMEKRKDQDFYIRELQMGVILRPDIAHSIGEWLLEKSKAAGYGK